MGSEWGYKTGYTARAPAISKNLDRQYQAYLKYLPQLLQATVGQQPEIERQQLRTAQEISPQYSQLALDQLLRFGTPMAQAGADTNLAMLRGTGAETARAADALNRELNPEYYATRTAASNQLDNLLKSINLGGLSGGERAEVERALAQSNTATGNLGLDNATTAVSNAMNFGEAFDKKRTALSNALSTATNFMAGSQNNTFNPTQLALSSTTPQLGANTFQPVTTSGNQAQQFGQNMLSGISQLGNTQMPLEAQSKYRASQQGIVEGFLGNVNCCFILLEATNGKLPWWVRHCRDWYYYHRPELAVGYKRMARWLVPLMKRYKIVKWFVNFIMVKPIIEHGGYMMGVKGCNNKSKVRDFWFNIWSKLAR